MLTHLYLHDCRQELADYELYLRGQKDISPVTIRNYLSDLRSFVTWYKTKSLNSTKVGFESAKITTPTLIRYRSYLQSQLKLAPASINRYLVTPKSYFALAVEDKKITTNPAGVVKLISLVKPSIYYEVGLDDNLARIGEFQDEGNNITSAPLSITLKETPDLQVTSLNIPERATVGQSFELDYSVKRSPPRIGGARGWGLV